MQIMHRTVSIKKIDEESSFLWRGIFELQIGVTLHKIGVPRRAPPASYSGGGLCYI